MLLSTAFGRYSPRPTNQRDSPPLYFQANAPFPVPVLALAISRNLWCPAHFDKRSRCPNWLRPMQSRSIPARRSPMHVSINFVLCFILFWNLRLLSQHGGYKAYKTCYTKGLAKYVWHKEEEIGHVTGGGSCRLESFFFCGPYVSLSKPDI